MDIPEKQNKAMERDAAANKAEDMPTRVTAATRLTQDYYFPENNGWQAITVRAADITEAQEKYRAMRKPVSPATQPEKVESENQSNNE